MRLHRLAGWALVVGTVWGQPEPSSSPAQQEPSQRSEYTGPAILSRGLGALLNPSQELLKLRPFASLSGIYDSGLASISVDETGKWQSRDAYGVEANFGVTGYHAWRRTLLGMQYQGRLRHYSRATYYDGLDQVLTLNATHYLSRRMMVQVTPGVASFSRSHFVPEVGSSYYSPELTALAGGELFDTRMNAALASGRLIYQRTARFSLSLGGNGFAAHRRSRALAGVTGYGASGDLAYRLSRYQTIGLDYQFIHYDFRRVFGDTDAHGIGFNYALQMGRHWTLALRAAGYRVEISRLQLVPLDPVIAAIVGQRAAISTTYRQLYIPAYHASLVRRYRRGTATIAYARGLSPGNGLYLTTNQERADAGLNYRGTRRASVYAHVAAQQYQALVQDLGRFRSYWANLGMNYRLGHSLSLSVSVEGRKYELHNTQLDRISYRARVGLSYSPGELPLSLW